MCSLHGAALHAAALEAVVRRRRRVRIEPFAPIVEVHALDGALALRSEAGGRGGAVRADRRRAEGQLASGSGALAQQSARLVRRQGDLDA